MRSAAGWLAGAGLCLALGAGCSAGDGEGELRGTVTVPGCDLPAEFDLAPSYFAGQTVGDTILELRVQRGSDLEAYSDGLAILVEDTPTIAREWIGTPVPLGVDGARVTVSLYLNQSCPADRRVLPVTLQAVAGTVTWSGIYAPSVDPDAVEIAARLTDLEFSDRDAPEARRAMLSGGFKFLYNRGRPAQRFP